VIYFDFSLPDELTMVLEYKHLQNWVIFGANVGKYSSTIEHMGLFE
jgi:hypothetical protein